MSIIILIVAAVLGFGLGSAIAWVVNSLVPAHSHSNLNQQHHMGCYAIVNQKVGWHLDPGQKGRLAALWRGMGETDRTLIIIGALAITMVVVVYLCPDWTHYMMLPGMAFGGIKKEDLMEYAEFPDSALSYADMSDESKERQQCLWEEQVFGTLEAGPVTVSSDGSPDGVPAKMWRSTYIYGNFSNTFPNGGYGIHHVEDWVNPEEGNPLPKSSREAQVEGMLNARSEYRKVWDWVDRQYDKLVEILEDCGFNDDYIKVIMEQSRRNVSEALFINALMLKMKQQGEMDIVQALSKSRSKVSNAIIWYRKALKACEEPDWRQSTREVADQPPAKGIDMYEDDPACDEGWRDQPFKDRWYQMEQIQRHGEMLVETMRIASAEMERLVQGYDLDRTMNRLKAYLKRRDDVPLMLLHKMVGTAIVLSMRKGKPDMKLLEMVSFFLGTKMTPSSLNGRWLSPTPFRNETVEFQRIRSNAMVYWKAMCRGGRFHLDQKQLSHKDLIPSGEKQFDWGRKPLTAGKLERPVGYDSQGNLMWVNVLTGESWYQDGGEMPLSDAQFASYYPTYEN